MNTICNGEESAEMNSHLLCWVFASHQTQPWSIWLYSSLYMSTVPQSGPIDFISTSSHCSCPANGLTLMSSILIATNEKLSTSIPASSSSASCLFARQRQCAHHCFKHFSFLLIVFYRTSPSNTLLDCFSSTLTVLDLYLNVIILRSSQKPYPVSKLPQSCFVSWAICARGKVNANEE